MEKKPDDEHMANLKKAGINIQAAREGRSLQSLSIMACNLARTLKDIRQKERYWAGMDGTFTEPGYPAFHRYAEAKTLYEQHVAENEARVREEEEQTSIKTHLLRVVKCSSDKLWGKIVKYTLLGIAGILVIIPLFLFVDAFFDEGFAGLFEAFTDFGGWPNFVYIVLVLLVISYWIG